MLPFLDSILMIFGVKLYIIAQKTSILLAICSPFITSGFSESRRYLRKTGLSCHQGKYSLIILSFQAFAFVIYLTADFPFTVIIARPSTLLDHLADSSANVG